MCLSVNEIRLWQIKSDYMQEYLSAQIWLGDMLTNSSCARYCSLYLIAWLMRQRKWLHWQFQPHNRLSLPRVQKARVIYKLLWQHECGQFFWNTYTSHKSTYIMNPLIAFFKVTRTSFSHSWNRHALQRQLYDNSSSSHTIAHTQAFLTIFPCKNQMQKYLKVDPPVSRKK